MRFQCSISLPSRGAFHRSLAVLCAIGRHGYLALEGGPPCFPRATSFPVVLAHWPTPLSRVSATGLSPPAADPSRPFAYLTDSPARSAAADPSQPLNPTSTTPAGLHGPGL